MIRSALNSSDGVADCIVRTTIIGCEAAYPLGLIALQKELIAIHRMRRELERLHVDIRGVHTDGIFWSITTVAGSQERLEQERGLQRLLALTRPNEGGPLYSLKPLPLDDNGSQRLHLVPGCPQNPWRPSLSRCSRDQRCECWARWMCPRPSPRAWA